MLNRISGKWDRNQIILDSCTVYVFCHTCQSDATQTQGVMSFTALFSVPEVGLTFV